MNGSLPYITQIPAIHLQTLHKALCLGVVKRSLDPQPSTHKVNNEMVRNVDLKPSYRLFPKQ
jgi:hypothetical protein